MFMVTGNYVNLILIVVFGFIMSLRMITKKD